MPNLIYLDNHATTPCDPRVVETMVPWFSQHFGNAGSRTHVFGLQAHAATERAREQLGNALGASPKEIVWTSGATESNNLAILGVARALREKGRHIVTTAIEHKAVLDPCQQLAREGFEITVLPVDADGLVEVDTVEKALRPDTILVSVMAANNEIGTLQPIDAIGAACRGRRIAFHVDAAQAFGRVSLRVDAIGCDFLSLSAHKFYGPKGIGALYVRRGRPRMPIQAVQFGGGQERWLRPGTLAVPLIVAMGLAAELAADDLHTDIARLRALRDALWDGIRGLGDVRLNGSWEKRLPNNLNCSFGGVDAEGLMMSMKEVALSSGSACTSATLEPSHVLRALRVDPKVAHTSIRFGIGRFNTAAEIDRVLELLRDRVPRHRTDPSF